MDNDENRKVRRSMRKVIEQKNMSDEQLHEIICACAKTGWVEELRLAVNVPRSSVEYFLYMLYIFHFVLF